MRERPVADEHRLVFWEGQLVAEWREVVQDEAETAHHYIQRVLEDFYDDRPTVELALRAKKRLPPWLGAASARRSGVGPDVQKLLRGRRLARQPGQIPHSALASLAVRRLHTFPIPRERVVPTARKGFLTSHVELRKSISESGRHREDEQRGAVQARVAVKSEGVEQRTARFFILKHDTGCSDKEVRELLVPVSSRMKGNERERRPRRRFARGASPSGTDGRRVEVLHVLLLPRKRVRNATKDRML
jgi:hypothetical protein